MSVKIALAILANVQIFDLTGGKTLAIIGIVAALVIPTVVKHYQERQTLSAVKKFYSSISQALEVAQVYEGHIEDWGWGTSGNGEDAAKILNKLSPYLKIIKNCGTSTGCFYEGTIKTLNGNTAMGTSVNTRSNIAKAILTDGMQIWLLVNSGNCSYTASSTQNICGYVGVDINGSKEPNRLGRDTFYFWITKNNVIPMGVHGDFYRNLSQYLKRFKYYFIHHLESIIVLME